MWTMLTGGGKVGAGTHIHYNYWDFNMTSIAETVFSRRAFKGSKGIDR